MPICIAILFYFLIEDWNEASLLDFAAAGGKRKITGPLQVTFATPWEILDKKNPPNTELLEGCVANPLKHHHISSGDLGVRM